VKTSLFFLFLVLGLPVASLAEPAAQSLPLSEQWKAVEEAVKEGLPRTAMERLEPIMAGTLVRGEYQSGLAEVLCMYAPEFNAHSASTPLEVR
jgi:hypothetical protein